jgi:hypothetical protein
MLNIAERRYVPRKGQSIFPCRTGGTDMNLTKMTPYTKTDERRYNYTQNLPHRGGIPQNHHYSTIPSQLTPARSPHFHQRPTHQPHAHNCQSTKVNIARTKIHFNNADGSDCLVLVAVAVLELAAAPSPFPTAGFGLLLLLLGTLEAETK